MILTRTPFRLSFFGGGTDYRPWFSEHGGLIIGTTFQRYCYISCRRLPPFFDYKTRIVYSKTELVQSNDDIQHPAIRGALSFLKIQDGVEVHHDGDLPARSGLGSSSTFTVGLLLALHAMRHEMPTKLDLANEAIEVEQNVIKENVGIQDQILAAHGGFRVIQIDRNGDYNAGSFILPPDYMQALEDHVLLGFTGLTRNATDLAGVQMKTIKSGKSRMSEIHGIAKEALALFNRHADISEVGALLDQSWKLKRTLAEGVSNSDIDLLYETARKAGAYGGKLLGAGGGGFFAFLAPPYQHQKIKDALKQLRVWVPFKFDKTGAQVVFHTDTY